MNGVMIVLPAFRYTFSSPPPLIFDESLLDIMGHPIVHTSFAPMEEAFQHLLFYQQEQYIKRQYNRLLVLNGGLLLVVMTWLLAAFLKRHRLKRKEKEQEKREQAVSKRLIQVMKEGKIDWPLLHVRLVILAQKKSGQKKEMTALELQSYFLSIHEERPAEAARLLQAHGYLESEEMKPFQAACSCII